MKKSIPQPGPVWEVVGTVGDLPEGIVLPSSGGIQHDNIHFLEAAQKARETHVERLKGG